MNDLDAELMALLGPGTASPQPHPQEPAGATPDLDLATLLNPEAGQAAPEPVATTIQADDFPAGQDQSDLAEAVQTDVREPIAKLREIAARRQELEEELFDLYQRLDTARELLKRGLWSQDHVKTSHGLARQIEAVTWSWSWTETQAWRVAFDNNLIPAWPRRADWSPFQLLEGTRP